MNKKFLLIIPFLFSLMIMQEANAQCKAAFTKSVNQATKTVTITNTSSSNITHYFWDFGDGTYSGWGTGSAFKNPVHQYTQGGSYRISLMVQDTIKKCGDSTSTAFYINVTCTSPASYSNANKTFYYYTSMPGALKLRFDFGDGTSSTKDSGQHVYSSLGTYNVCLTVYCSSTDSSKTCNSYNLKSNCTAKFYVPGKDSMTKFTHSFYNQSSTSSTMKYLWKFGDGSTSSSNSPTHTYTAQGNYNVCLYITDAPTKCSDSICTSIKIKKFCDSNFYVTSRLDTLIFSYSGSAPNVKWNFGNGKTSTSKNGKHVYGTLGNFTICLTAYCSSTDSSKKCISYTLSTIPCKAAFKKSLDTSQKFKVLLINNSTNTSSTTYKWDFGDGGTSTSRNPSHKYNTFGKYFVCLTVKDGTCSSYACDTVGMDSSGRLLKAGGFGIEVIEAPAGINKTIKSDFKIYPNPANTKISIELLETNLQFEKLEIISVTGQVCISQSVANNSEIIDVNVESLNPGLYLIKLSNDQGYSLSKMMKN